MLVDWTAVPAMDLSVLHGFKVRQTGLAEQLGRQKALPHMMPTSPHTHTSPCLPDYPKITCPPGPAKLRPPPPNYMQSPAPHLRPEVLHQAGEGLRVVRRVDAAGQHQPSGQPVVAVAAQLRRRLGRPVAGARKGEQLLEHVHVGAGQRLLRARVRI
jgi:hypothetical protein